MSKKRILNIKPQEIVTNGRRSVQFKGSDGKMHALASSENGSDQGGPIAAPTTAKSYAIDNNPNAFELVLDKYVNGTATYKAVTCDESKTEITVADLIDILLADPQTIVITDAKLSGSIVAVDVLRVATITEDRNQITMFGYHRTANLFKSSGNITLQNTSL